jgi:hypothetical protein
VIHYRRLAHSSTMDLTGDLEWALWGDSSHCVDDRENGLHPGEKNIVFEIRPSIRDEEFCYA